MDHFPGGAPRPGCFAEMILENCIIEFDKSAIANSPTKRVFYATAVPWVRSHFHVDRRHHHGLDPVM
jgi:hypothetical protein